MGEVGAGPLMLEVIAEMVAASVGEVDRAALDVEFMAVVFALFPPFPELVESVAVAVLEVAMLESVVVEPVVVEPVVVEPVVVESVVVVDRVVGLSRLCCLIPQSATVKLVKKQSNSKARTFDLIVQTISSR